MDIQKLMKQAQQMQAKMQEAQEALAQKTVTAEVGGGQVKVVMNGQGEALYFSRSLVPHPRGQTPRAALDAGVPRVRITNLEGLCTDGGTCFQL